GTDVAAAAVAVACYSSSLRPRHALQYPPATTNTRCQDVAGDCLHHRAPSDTPALAPLACSNRWSRPPWHWRKHPRLPLLSRAWIFASSKMFRLSTSWVGYRPTAITKVCTRTSVLCP
ncbi:unnamed protein product, partial [Ectocarpus sp. 12 AP-2014]